MRKFTITIGTLLLSSAISVSAMNRDVAQSQTHQWDNTLAMIRSKMYAIAEEEKAKVLRSDPQRKDPCYHPSTWDIERPFDGILGSTWGGWQYLTEIFNERFRFIISRVLVSEEVVIPAFLRENFCLCFGIFLECYMEILEAANEAKGKIFYAMKNTCIFLEELPKTAYYPIISNILIKLGNSINSSINCECAHRWWLILVDEYDAIQFLLELSGKL